jgi:hypothetical protein
MGKYRNLGAVPKVLKFKEKLARSKINMVSETKDSCGTVFIFADDGDGDLKKIDLCLADG